MLVLDKNLRVVSASQVYYSTFQVVEKDIIGNLLYHLGNGQWAIPQLRLKLEEVITKNQGFDDYIVEHTFEKIGNRRMKVSGRAISSGKDSETMVLMQIEDTKQINKA